MIGDSRMLQAERVYYDRGMFVLQQDSKKAFKLWTKAAELGSRNAHFNLYLAFSKFYAKAGVERDMKKAIYHLEISAIKGDGGSRCALKNLESSLGNLDRAKKHGMLSAGMACDSSLNVCVLRASRRCVKAL